MFAEILFIPPRPTIELALVGTMVPTNFPDSFPCSEPYPKALEQGTEALLGCGRLLRRRALLIVRWPLKNPGDG
jgi:hypothetical protein